MHRRPRRTAATRNLTGALSRDTLAPERSLPVSVPSATPPLAVARKLVMFALIEKEDDVAAGAEAGAANATAAVTAASKMGRGFMPSLYPSAQIQIDIIRAQCASRTHDRRRSSLCAVLRRCDAQH